MSAKNTKRDDSIYGVTREYTLNICDKICMFCCELEQRRDQQFLPAKLSVIVKYNKLRSEVGVLPLPTKSQKQDDLSVQIPDYLDCGLAGKERNADVLNRAYQLRDYLYANFDLGIPEKRANLEGKTPADKLEKDDGIKAVATALGIPDHIISSLGESQPIDRTPEQLRSFLKKTLANNLDKILKEGTCSRTGWAGVKSGNCEHAIGLPGNSIPGQHDGNDDTVDEYNKPNGWCWSCWKSHQIEKLRKEVQALEAWQEVAAASNRDVSAYLQEKFPSLELDGGMPVDNVRKAMDCMEKMMRPVERLDNPRRRPTLAEEAAEQALGKLSGDLSHDNVAAAKQILRDVLGLMICTCS